MAELWKPRKANGKRKAYFYGRVRQLDGSRRVVSTGQSDREAARIALARLQRDAADPTAAARKRAAPLGALLDGFFAAREVTGGHGRCGVSAGTRHMYRWKRAALVGVLGEARDLQQLGLEDLERYIGARRAAGTGDVTIGKELTVLRAALRRAKRVGTWHGDVDAIWPEFRPAVRARSRFLTEDELERLCGELAPSRARLVQFLCWTGARDSEWQALKAEHVDLRRRCVHLHGTKTMGSDRIFPIVTPALEQLLRRLLLERRGGLLFDRWCSVRRDLHRACDRAKIAPVSPNDLRRTFATWCRQRGMPVDRIARLLGHCDSRLVERVYGQLGPADLGHDIARAFVPRLAPADVEAGPEDSRSEYLELGPDGQLVVAEGAE